MMWFLTFLRVLFRDCYECKIEKLSDILCHAYDEAFGNNHGWIVRNSAKLAIKASCDKKKLI
jgi:hypothetical protein